MMHKRAAKSRGRVRAAKRRSVGRGGGSNFISRAVRYNPASPSRTSSSKKTKRSAAKKTKKRREDKDDFVKGLVFVAMSFQEKGGDEVFKAIKEACKTMRLNARRVDENTSSGFIILEIIDLIEKAEFIVFDLTHERPNVYYELGYTHGVGNSPSNILLLAKHGTKLHFDIAALRVRFYKSTEELRDVIKKNLTAMMKMSRQ
jgi:hypothetical protein